MASQSPVQLENLSSHVNMHTHTGTTLDNLVSLSFFGFGTVQHIKLTCAALHKLLSKL